MKTTLTIIGGGAAGLMAAVFAGRRGLDVTLIERNTSVGRKLLKTGRGRCNYTHTGDIRHFVKQYDYCGRFLRHCLHEFSPQDTIRFFEQIGVKGKIEKDGCIFPQSDKAATVKNALLEEANRLGTKFIYGRRVEHITKTQTGFTVGWVKASSSPINNSERDIECEKVIIATGGESWPALGADGDGYRFAAELGHTIVMPIPALTGLITADPTIKQLQGVAVPKITISAKVNDKKISQSGPMMFTNKGIGGPAIFNFSRFIAETINEGKHLNISLDLLPQTTHDQLRNTLLTAAEKSPRKTVLGLVSELLPKRLAAWLTARAGISESTPIGQTAKSKLNSLAARIKSLQVEISGTCDFAEATITRGGIPLEEIDSKTMQSKLCPGLFFAGEIISADGPCGGYNLQIAWSTAALAANSV